MREGTSTLSSSTVVVLGKSIESIVDGEKDKHT